MGLNKCWSERDNPVTGNTGINRILAHRLLLHYVFRQLDIKERYCGAPQMLQNLEPGGSAA